MSFLRTTSLATGIFLVGATAACAAPACDSDNGGLKLPPGFCAQVVANDLGAARHAVVAPNGDLYVALMNGGVAALHSTRADGKFDVTKNFGKGSTTGIALRNGYLYIAHPTTVERYKMTPGQLVPSGEPEIIVQGLPTEGEHRDKGLTFDGKGSLYVNVGSPSNACQSRDRQEGVPGQDPCPLLETHGGIWRFDENKLGQKQSDGEKYLTGLRQEPAITWHDGAVYITMNSRDQLDTLWPGKFDSTENAMRPAEPMYRGEKGTNFGWPYCYFDYGQQKNLLNPEYGGDGKTVGRCANFNQPIASYPAHWAPVDMMFYSAVKGPYAFPDHYRDGAFIAFHGSWNRAPLPQEPANVTFQPFSHGKPSGKFEVFASNFAGKDPLMNPNDALARADGVAEAPDGTLYITESQKGKIWHIFYTGAK